VTGRSPRRAAPEAAAATAEERRIPDASVARLGTYHRALVEARDAGAVTVSSERLAALAGVNASQVRKDLSYLGSTGTRGVGYDVGFLVLRIGAALGLNRHWAVAIVGVGNLGQALANYRGLGARGFVVAALVDADPAKVGRRVAGLVVEPLTDLDRIVAARDVRIGVIATPAGAAQEVATRLVRAGVRAILNFAPAPVTVPAGVSVRNVDLALELQVLSYHEAHAAQTGRTEAVTRRTRGAPGPPRTVPVPADPQRVP